MAIIPFENKGDKTDEFYSYGLSTDLISSVSSTGLLRVASIKDIEILDYQNIKNTDLSKNTHKKSEAFSFTGSFIA